MCAHTTAQPFKHNCLLALIRRPKGVLLVVNMRRKKRSFSIVQVSSDRLSGRKSRKQVQQNLVSGLLLHGPYGKLAA